MGCCNSKKANQTPSDMKEFKKEMRDEVESDENNDLTTKTTSKDAAPIINESPK